MVITPQREYLARAEGWVRKLDARAERSERQFCSYAVATGALRNLVNVLQALFSPEGDGEVLTAILAGVPSAAHPRHTRSEVVVSGAPCYWSQTSFCSASGAKTKRTRTGRRALAFSPLGGLHR